MFQPLVEIVLDDRSDDFDQILVTETATFPFTGGFDHAFERVSQGDPKQAIEFRDSHSFWSRRTFHLASCFQQMPRLAQ